MILIEDFISDNPENAITARRLAEIIGGSVRDVMQAIQDRRRAGVPIIGERGANPGFYLTSDSAQIENYCRRLKHEAREIERTADAVAAWIEDQK